MLKILDEQVRRDAEEIRDKYPKCKFLLINIDITNLQNLPDEKHMIDEGYEVKYLGGFVKSNKIKFYKVPVKQFTIGNINLRAQNIWVTFSMDVTESVLGMDILKQITFFI